MAASHWRICTSTDGHDDVISRRCRSRFESSKSQRKMARAPFCANWWAAALPIPKAEFAPARAVFVSLSSPQARVPSLNNVPVMMTTLPSTRGPWESGATVLMGGIPRWLSMACSRRLAESDMLVGTSAVNNHKLIPLLHRVINGPRFPLSFRRLVSWHDGFQHETCIQTHLLSTTAGKLAEAQYDGAPATSNNYEPLDHIPFHVLPVFPKSCRSFFSYFQALGRVTFCLLPAANPQPVRVSLPSTELNLRKTGAAAAKPTMAMHPGRETPSCACGTG